MLRMIVKGKFEIDIPEKLLAEAKRLGWSKQTIKLMVQDALDSYIKDVIYEGIAQTIEDEKEIKGL